MSPVPVTLKRSLNDLQHNLVQRAKEADFATPRYSRSKCQSSSGLLTVATIAGQNQL